MRQRAALICAGIAVFALAIAGPLIVTAFDNGVPELKTPPLDAASVSVDHFFDTYVDAEGRVLETSDTTSGEAQANALLLAAASSDRTKFDLVWRWTQDHLLLDNGLMASSWRNGTGGDRNVNPDADVVAARALAVASRNFVDPALLDRARTIASSVVESGRLYAFGASTLLTNQSAEEAERSGSVAFYPGRFSPRADGELVSMAGEQPWSQLTATRRQLLDQLIGTSRERLPPDVTSLSIVDRTVSVSEPQQGRYGKNAASTVLNLAESCANDDRERASQIWGILNRSRDSRSAALLELDGSVADKSPSAPAAVASAAGASASRDEIQMHGLLDYASYIETERSSYAGAVSVALGRVMLTTHWLGNC